MKIIFENDMQPTRYSLAELAPGLVAVNRQGVVVYTLRYGLYIHLDNSIGRDMAHSRAAMWIKDWQIVEATLHIIRSQS